MKRRPYLVWVSTNHGKCAAELDGKDRLFDVALHDYGPWSPVKSNTADFWIDSEGTEKFETAAANPLLLLGYEYVAFLDDDLDITTHDLNNMFEIGKRFHLNLFQPALTLASYGTYRHLYQDPIGYKALGVREVPFVEIMCPVFSKFMLERCLWTFDLNQSGWGLDVYIWPKLCVHQYCLDKVPIRHMREPSRRDRKNRSGLTCFQECDIVKKIGYDGPNPW